MSKKTPFRGKYWIQSRVGYWVLFFIDLVVRLFPKRCKTALHPKKILVSNIGHLGDVVIATAVLNKIKEKYPNSQIGFLVGGWAKGIVENHPLVDHVHIVDHWKINRANLSKWKKYRHYRKTYRKTLLDLRALSYDVAIDLYSFFPNVIFLLWHANIPKRIGYTSGGFAPLLTDPYSWTQANQYLATYHFDLLQKLSIHLKSQEELKPFLSSKKKELSLPENYYVFHIGSGNPLKEWPVQDWRVIAQEMSDQGKSIIFTGVGISEKQQIQQIVQGLDHCFDFCDELSWDAFVSVIQGSQLVLSCDSVAPHIAASFNRPTIVLSAGISQDTLWFYPSSNRVLLRDAVSCAPCFKKQGCASMSCIRGISPKKVIHSIQSILVT